jgi:hypothetical protein
MAAYSAIVIAGGSTVADYDVSNLLARGRVIGVNDASIHAAVHMALTMDRLWLEYRYKQLKFLMDCNKLEGVWARAGTTQNIPEWQDLGFVWFERANTDDFTHGLRNLNGSSSGTAAINLALSMGAEKIYLLGFDMKMRGEKRYWYPSYPWITYSGGTKPGVYNSWAKRFRHIRNQCHARGSRLINVTHDSAIPEDSVERMTFEQFLKETE